MTASVTQCLPLQGSQAYIRLYQAYKPLRAYRRKAAAVTESLRDRATEVYVRIPAYYPFPTRNCQAALKWDESASAVNLLLWFSNLNVHSTVTLVTTDQPGMYCNEVQYKYSILYCLIVHTICHYILHFHMLSHGI